MATNNETPTGSPPPAPAAAAAAAVGDIGEPQELFIDGAYTASSDGATFPVYNPMTGAKLYDCASASEADYARAIEAAAAASEAWARTGPSARRLLFLRAAEILERLMATEAPALMSAEVSATRHWTRVNAVSAVGLLREAAGLASQIKGEILPADAPGTTVLVERQPLGVVLAISPWNAPASLTVRAIATPLVCGNTVILKPSEFSPKNQHLVVRAMREAGLPRGCLHFLPTSPARTPAATEFAIKHPLVRHVNFTGSDRVGRIIAGHAATCLKRCVLELGGKAPVIVLDDADLEDAAEAVAFGALANAGQVCMSTERVIVHAAAAARFTDALLARVRRVAVGDPAEDPGVSVSGLFTPASAARVRGLLADAVAAGARLLCGDGGAPSGPNRTVVAPHVVDAVTPAMDIWRRESFGPVVCLAAFASDAEAVALANDSDYSLSAAVFSRDVMRALDVARRVRAGSCHVNNPSVYIAAGTPNGGVGGASGYGRFGGTAGLQEFTELKIISLGRSGVKYPF
ncbi:putative salicylaldehyde dehydrogenase [Rosellinia necatrix]|uniref:Putative salicylaldehyde dehydrogenase n=1 Tax=Rosellinia necatrix TaxID=77044 RepID=A0A1W2TEH2_ROSNE|nr:putative salicylaldehyde dehydrogenase [Rosellinia necatrix]